MSDQPPLPHPAPAPPLSRRALLQLGAAAVALTGFARETVAQTPAPMRLREITYGADPAFAAPTEADLYVSPTGDDTAPGSREAPLRTLAQAVARMAERGPGTRLAIRGGLYREAVSLRALQGRAEAPYTLHRYGTEPVTISAAEPLEGWAPVPPETAARLGLSEPDTLLQVRLPDTLRPPDDDPRALNLHADGRPCPLAFALPRSTDPRAIEDHTQFFPAVVGLTDGDLIGTLSNPYLQGLSETDLNQAQLLVYVAPNLVRPAAIAAFDPVRGQITLADPPRAQMRQEEPVGFFALRNTPQGLRPGAWMVRRDGAEITLYYRLAAPGDPVPAFEVSTRTHCLDIGDAQHVHLIGLDTERAAGQGWHSAVCIRRWVGGTPSTGLVLRHCSARQTLHSGGRGPGAMTLIDCRDLTLDHLSISDVTNGFGLFLSDCTGVDLRHLHATRTAQAPGRFFTIRDMVFAFSHLEDSAWGTHANTFNFYEGCDTILVYGIKAPTVGGYVTYQKASRIHFGFCEFQVGHGTFGRALASQNASAGRGQGGADGSGDPVAGGTFHYWNTNFLANPRAPNEANSLSLGPEGSSQTHAVHNCLIHGGGFARVYTGNANPDREIRSHNVYTALSWWQTAGHGWRLGPGEVTGSVAGATRLQGWNMGEILLRELVPAFPGFTDWRLDIDGYAVDWNRPPIGCRVPRG